MTAANNSFIHACKTSIHRARMGQKFKREDTRVKQGQRQYITVTEYHTDQQLWLLSGRPVSCTQGPAGGSGWAYMQSLVSEGPGSAQWHVSVWLVGLTVHRLTDCLRHAQTAAQPFLLSLSPRRHEEKGDQEREGAHRHQFTKKKKGKKRKTFRHLVSLAPHKASTLQVTEKEKIVYPLSGTRDS